MTAPRPGRTRPRCCGTDDPIVGRSAAGTVPLADGRRQCAAIRRIVVVVLGSPRSWRYRPPGPVGSDHGSGASGDFEEGAETGARARPWPRISAGLLSPRSKGEGGPVPATVRSRHVPTSREGPLCAPSPRTNSTMPCGSPWRSFTRHPRRCDTAGPVRWNGTAGTTEHLSDDLFAYAVQLGPKHRPGTARCPSCGRADGPAPGERRSRERGGARQPVASAGGQWHAAGRDGAHDVTASSRPPRLRGFGTRGLRRDGGRGDPGAHARAGPRTRAGPEPARRSVRASARPPVPGRTGIHGSPAHPAVGHRTRRTARTHAARAHDPLQPPRLQRSDRTSPHVRPPQPPTRWTRVVCGTSARDAGGPPRRGRHRRRPRR
ncbi:hypothetical protein FHX42_003985 [Saccharopolyspora lacisalsi]|uniref:Uncharacterized protein n=1 Tax=Halosaccharopolyspora lacisalsi TaxID=1000566 RepID=A0A839E228_9PSEU|nr:hypothetical protein [Halosaccharopolyspora lacisalsi]